jgi:hypothetical protein
VACSRLKQPFESNTLIERRRKEQRSQLLATRKGTLYIYAHRVGAASSSRYFLLLSSLPDNALVLCVALWCSAPAQQTRSCLPRGNYGICCIASYVSCFPFSRKCTHSIALARRNNKVTSARTTDKGYLLPSKIHGRLTPNTGDDISVGRPHLKPPQSPRSRWQQKTTILPMLPPRPSLTSKPDGCTTRPTEPCRLVQEK